MKHWSSRREYLNHHLVKNQLIMLLYNLERVAKGLVVSSDDSGDLANNLRKLWNNIQEDSRELHATVIDEMSPKVHFDKPPLCHCSEETVQWLKPFAHEQWRSKTQVDARRAVLAAAIERAENAMNRLFLCMDQTDTHQSHVHCLTEARAAATMLHETLAAMPKNSVPWCTDFNNS